MKFQDLPGIPGVWIDFTAGNCAGVAPPVPFDGAFLRAHLERVKQHASRLEKPVQEAASENSPLRSAAAESLLQIHNSGSVAVVANIEAGIFGGALSQFLKCLTAVKLSRELARHTVNAVPVCWITVPRSTGPDFPGPVRMLDPGSELRRLSLQAEETCDFQYRPNVPSGRISNLIERLAEIGGERYDPEVLELLKISYAGGATWSCASAHLFSGLMNGWGVLTIDSGAPGFQSGLYAACRPLLQDLTAESPSRIIDGNRRMPGYDGSFPDSRETPPGYFIQSCVLPVFARVLDPNELPFYLDARPGFESMGLVEPIPWPASSATIIDARRRKTMQKYGLLLQDILKGEESVLRNLTRGIAHSPLITKLDSVKSEMERHMEDLKGPGMDGGGFRKAKSRCRQRIAYQLDKIIDRAEKAGLEKQAVMRRRIQRTCGFLAPDGLRQEDGLHGISFPLLHSRAIFSFLYDNLDIMKFEHQILCLE